MAPFDSLVPSPLRCRRAYLSRLSGHLPPGSLPLGFPHLGGGEDVGSPRVTMRTQYPHAHLTHPAAVHHAGFPADRAGRPPAATLVVGSFPLGLRACLLRRLPVASLRGTLRTGGLPPRPVLCYSLLVASAVVRLSWLPGATIGGIAFPPGEFMLLMVRHP
jgi:hypothetical protein